MGRMRKKNGLDDTRLVKTASISVPVIVFILAMLVSASGQSNTWKIEVVDNAGYVGVNNSLALDSHDNPHISYYDHLEGNLKYARWTDSGWEIEVVDNSGNVGEHTSLAIDSHDNPHISYLDYTNKDLKYAHWTGSAWIVEVVDNRDNAGSFASIALDENDFPHISYTYNGILQYACWNGENWGIETVDNSQYRSDTSIVLDKNGYPHISYSEWCVSQNNDLRYAWWDGENWNIQVVDEAYLDNGIRGTSIALDGSGYPYISYCVLPTMPSFLISSTRGILKCARWTGENWVIETVDNGGDLSNVEWDTSIVLDKNDRPHISYYDWGHKQVKYASWDGEDWTIEIVDNISVDTEWGSYFGRWNTSIALDRNNNPYISYCDLINGEALKLASVRVSSEVPEFPWLILGGSVIIIIVILSTIYYVVRQRKRKIANER